MAEQRVILLALPTAGMPVPNDPSSHRYRGDCGHEVWIGGSSDALILERDPLVVCTACRPTPDRIKILPPTREQRAALLELGVTNRDIRRVLREVRRGG